MYRIFHVLILIIKIFIWYEIVSFAWQENRR
jgi:hypothetical protein